MKIEARHVRRKQLSQYLDSDFLKSERSLTENSISSLYASTNPIRKRLSTDSVQNAKKMRVNDSVSCNI